MRMRRFSVIGGLLLAVGFGLAADGRAQQAAPVAPPVILSGPDVFRLSEVMIVSGAMAHHRLTDDLFRIDGLWLNVTPGTEFHRWLSLGIDRNVSVILTPHPDRFADVKGVRILTGTMIHNTAPSASPIVHEAFLKDLTTGALSAVTFETTDVAVAKTFDYYDNAEVSIVIEVK
jgi:hypothetical protein